MGIPGLARRLEPYATRYSPEQLEGYSAVIDGPALAYYAHKLALSASTSPARIPSYVDIIAEAIRWLNGLEQMNIKVSKIFFDGALPSSKRTERISRTENNNRRVQQLRASYPTTACPVPTYLGAISYAFLAPALREALIGSPFASRTQIVPGEADDWCALHAKANARSIVFTSDTDLVLYSYLPETLIVFLHDADISAGLKAYSPDQIRQKLQLDSLILFAFVLREGPTDTASDLNCKARAVDQESAEYINFSRRYVAQIVAPAYLSNSPTALPESDVRVSEFVHQALEGSTTPFVYLPLLIEDPNQASAWCMGQDIRTLAYSLLATQHMVVHEYRRKAQAITVHEVNTYSATNLLIPATDLERQVSTLAEWAASKEIGPELLWPFFALSLVVVDLNTPPAIPLVLRVINGDYDQTWAFVHLMARIQAALYSLRMLGQVVKIWLSLNPAVDTKMYKCLSSLSKHMENFPSIPTTFGVPGQAKQVVADHELLKKLIEEIYTSAGAELPTEQVSNKKKKRQTREAERKKRKTEQRQQSKPGATNAYALLYNA